MNFRQLRYFIGVVEAGNMTRAAEAMNVAQTALSTQIRQLEEDLGVALLVRHSRGIEPTEAGKLLQARGQELLRQLEDIRHAVKAIGTDSGERVRFGITPALMLIIGADLIDGVHEHLPGVSFSLVEAMSHVLVGSLLNGDLDYALCYDAPDEPKLNRKALLQEDLVFVTLPGRHKGSAVALADILDDRLAMPDAGDTVRLAVAKAARDLGQDLRVAYEVRSIAAMKSLALRGTASCILPLASVVEEVKAKQLIAMPIVKPPIRRMLYLVSANQRGPMRSDTALSVAIEASLAILVDLLGPLAHPLTT